MFPKTREEWEPPVRREWEDKVNAQDEEASEPQSSLRNKETSKKTCCPKIPDAGEVFKPDPDMEAFAKNFDKSRHLAPPLSTSMSEMRRRNETPPMNSSNEGGRKGLVRP